MQIWLAYALDRIDPTSRAIDGVRRVESHYSAIAPHPLQRKGWMESDLGLVTWDAPNAASRWPIWQETETLGVATAFVPVGWRNVVGETPPAEGPVTVGTALRKNPSLAGQLTPPFALGLLDRRDVELFIINDILGYARVYELRFRGGRAWSSQLGALPVFAGLRPIADSRGWGLFGATGWFMGDATPIQGASMLPPGTAITVRRKPSGRGITEFREQTVAIPDFIETRSENAAVEDTAIALQNVARDACTLWDHPPIVDLSGGRDSRLVAATALSIGKDVVLRTQALYAGETETASQLVKLLKVPVAHEVNPPTNQSSGGSLRQRCLSLHANYDGLFAPPPLPLIKGLHPPDRAHMRGTGGEIAHGFYYPRNKLQPTATKGLVGHLQGVLTIPAASTRRASRVVRHEITDAIVTALSHGIQGLTLFDYFYLVERLRRWSGGSTRPGLISPLIAPQFIRASFDLPPEERAGSRLHLDLIPMLIPEWNGIPFFRPSPEDRSRAIQRPLLWDTSDRAEFEEVLSSPQNWSDVFRPRAIRALWSKTRIGKATLRDEAVFYRVAARHFYAEHLRQLDHSAQHVTSS